MKHKTCFILINLLVFVIVAGCVSCNNETKKTNDMTIKWQELTTEGISGDLEKGVSATYTASVNDKLIVAGGANFPGKLGFEGGKKAYYDVILALDTIENNTWQIVGKLPNPSAYGVSVQTDDAAYWIGGETYSGPTSNVYKVSLTNLDSIQLDSIVSLPVTMDNFAGCAFNNLIFVGGGNINGKPGNQIYSLDTKKGKEWIELKPFPGLPRVQPVMVAIESDGKQFVYLFGGFFGGNESNKPEMATEVYRYSVAANSWEKVADQLDEKTQKPFSLGGATAMPLNNQYILCLGGVNYNVFLDAITSQYNINFNKALSQDEKKLQNYNFSKDYMTQPVEFYNFNKECRVFDTTNNTWKIIDNTSNAARAGATLVFNKNKFYAVQGELKPGVRTKISMKGTVEFKWNQNKNNEK